VTSLSLCIYLPLAGGGYGCSNIVIKKQSIGFREREGVAFMMIIPPLAPVGGKGRIRGGEGVV